MATENKVEHWRSRAAEALQIAGQITNPETKATMLSIAAEYERMAEQAERHEKALRQIMEG